MNDENKVKECIGCGYCCKKSPCALAIRIYGNGITSCPELIWDEDAHRYWCRACMGDGELRAEYRAQLHIGAGCCSPLNSDRQKIIAPVRKKGVNILPRETQIILSIIAKQWLSGDHMYFILSDCKKEFGEEWYNEAIRCMKEQRSSIAEDFMGGELPMPLKEAVK